MAESLQTAPGEWLAAHTDDLVELTRALVSHRSENRPPRGEEAACQAFVADYLRGLGLEPDVFQPDAVAGALEHPAWWPGRDYAGRPNVVARLDGHRRRPLAALLGPRGRRARARRRSTTPTGTARSPPVGCTAAARST